MRLERWRLGKMVSLVEKGEWWQIPPTCTSGTGGCGKRGSGGRCDGRLGSSGPDPI